SAKLTRKGAAPAQVGRGGDSRLPLRPRAASSELPAAAHASARGYFFVARRALPVVERLRERRAVVRLAVERLAVLPLAVLRLAVERFAVDFFAELLLAVDFLRPVGGIDSSRGGLQMQIPRHVRHNA